MSKTRIRKALEIIQQDKENANPSLNKVELRYRIENALTEKQEMRRGDIEIEFIETPPVRYGTKWKENKTGEIYKAIGESIDCTDNEIVEKVLYELAGTENKYVWSRDKEEFLEKFTRY